MFPWGRWNRTLAFQRRGSDGALAVCNLIGGSKLHSVDPLCVRVDEEHTVRLEGVLVLEQLAAGRGVLQTGGDAARLHLGNVSLSTLKHDEVGAEPGADPGSVAGVGVFALDLGSFDLEPSVFEKLPGSSLAPDRVTCSTHAAPAVERARAPEGRGETAGKGDKDENGDDEPELGRERAKRGHDRSVPRKRRRALLPAGACKTLPRRGVPCKSCGPPRWGSGTPENGPACRGTLGERRGADRGVAAGW